MIMYYYIIMNNKYNIVTICSALIFFFLTIFPENNKNNIIIYILIFTSLIYKYLHIYNNYSTRYIISRKVDQITICILLFSYINHFYDIRLKNIHLISLSTIVNYNFKLFKISLFLSMFAILYFSFKTDIFISSILLISTIISIYSYYYRLLLNKWTIEISWCWHLSCCCILTCLTILSSELFIPL